MYISYVVHKTTPFILFTFVIMPDVIFYSTIDKNVVYRIEQKLNGV